MHCYTDLVEWLLDHQPSLVNAETTGHFFDPGGTCYFGGLPLLFAVATNQSRMVELILDAVAEEPLVNHPCVADRFGNNSLHMAVIYDLPEMYDLILNVVQRRYALDARQVQMQVNKECLAPLALAAAMGRVRMFQHILCKTMVGLWSFGPVTSRMIPLRGLEQPALVHTSHGELRLSGHRLALGCMCAAENEQVTQCIPFVGGTVGDEVYKGRLDIIMLLEVQQLLDQKWERFGKRIYYSKLAVVFLTQVLWMVSTMIPNHYSVDPGNLRLYPVENGVIITLEVFVLLFVVRRLLWDAFRLAHYGLGYFAKSKGVMALNDCIGVLFCTTWLVGAALRVAGNYPRVEAIFTATACLVGWAYMFIFLVGFRSTGPFIIMIYETIRVDLRKFLAVYFTVLLGFTMAIHSAVYDDSPSPENFFWTLRNLFIIGSIGEFVLTEANSRDFCPNVALFNALLLLYIIFATVLLMTLLVAILSYTYSKVLDSVEKHWQVERANMMVAFETEFSLQQMHQKRRLYSAPLPSTPNGMDCELYLNVTMPDELWVSSIRIQEHRLIEERARRDLGEEEERDWHHLTCQRMSIESEDEGAPLLVLSAFSTPTEVPFRFGFGEPAIAHSGQPRFRRKSGAHATLIVSSCHSTEDSDGPIHVPHSPISLFNPQALAAPP
eukprot:GGOE01003561.1.p1 GENE.GGOE01003561.1~~GGOE01003561.1.p1  ORF type:complete len:665 (-),score=190.39 GGOE01003561.1:20-2014(-)